MKKTMKCNICKKNLFSSIGRGCVLCGMPVEQFGLFCCGRCRRKHNQINSTGGKIR